MYNQIQLHAVTLKIRYDDKGDHPKPLIAAN